MIVVPTPIVGFGLDTSAKITPALLAALERVDMSVYFPDAPKGHPPDFLGRYGPLPENAPGNDIDAAETALVTPVMPIAVFQHVRGGSWLSSAGQGQADAEHLLQYLQEHGWTGAFTPCKDCESCANSGLAAMQAFRDECLKQGSLAAGYNGFASGITPEQWASLGIPVARDAAQRTPPPGRGYAYEQLPQVQIAGVYFDPVRAMPDMTGATLIGMGAPQAPESGPYQHQDPSGPVSPVADTIPPTS